MTIKKGVLLAGGTGKRLYPLTKITNKHLLPIYKKPMIMYPLETLINAGIEDILIVTGGEHVGDFFRLLGSGSEWGVRFHYEIQEGSEGTGAALSLAKTFVGDDPFITILGDNILYENIQNFKNDFNEKEGYKAKVLVTRVNDPENYGVIEFDNNRITQIIEKPSNPKSNYISTGLWIFQPEIFSLLKNLEKSERNEYELTAILNHYARMGELSYMILDSPWTDAGTFDSLHQAIILVKKYEDEKNSRS